MPASARARRTRTLCDNRTKCGESSSELPMREGKQRSLLRIEDLATKAFEAFVSSCFRVGAELATKVNNNCVPETPAPAWSGQAGL